MTGLTPKQHALLEWIKAHAPMNIYQLARSTGRPYRRVHDHVYALARAGHLVLRRERYRGRERVLALDRCHQRLERLDDLYHFYRVSRR